MSHGSGKWRSLALATFVVTLGLSFGSPAWALPFTGIVAFGDSLADSGNNALVTPQRTAVPVTDPAQIIPTYPYASGRYTNGPVWVEGLAASLGLSLAPSLAGGSNYAFGGARSGSNGGAFPPGMSDQVGMYLQASGGFAPGGNLYVLQAGGNDARDALALASQGVDPTTILSGYAAHVASELQALAHAGARNFLVANVPDIGWAPAVAAFGPQASALASYLAAAMNDALAGTLASLALPAGSVMYQLDLYDLLGDLARSGQWDASTICVTSVACSANPTGVLFWDGIHPTTAVHEIAAQAALAVLPNQLPVPGTLGLMLVACGVLLCVNVSGCGSRAPRPAIRRLGEADETALRQARA